MQSLAPLAMPPAGAIDQKLEPTRWFLGIDIGTTGISAVLVNTLTGKLHPVYWYGAALVEVDRYYRLPTATTTDTGLWLQNFKSALKTGIPYHSAQTLAWEPVLQWTDGVEIPLLVLQLALQSLLSTLTGRSVVVPSGLGQLNSEPLACGANGLEPVAFTQAIAHLDGVIVGYPVNWSDTYSFNVREAVLAAGVVSQAEQIFFVEDVIATVLSGLRDLRTGTEPGGRSLTAGWRGKTLAVSIGATATELAVVDIPAQVQELGYNAFTVRSLAYAGNAIDQDIVCRLLYPQILKRKFGKVPSSSPTLPLLTPDSSLPGVNQDLWQAFTLEDLTIPLAGEPDLDARLVLQRRLYSSPVGRDLLSAAQRAKLALQTQDRVTVEVGQDRWAVTRQQFESQVLLPFMQKLNRELNALFSQAKLDAQAIRQVICTGGTASFSVVTRWLRQKMPQAVLIQDSYADERFVLSACSRVAYGLAILPDYPQVLDWPRHQYSDYFLLLEVLRHFPEQAVTLSSMMQHLEHWGVNTQVCQTHLLALLEGHLPPGFLPNERSLPWFSSMSQQNPEYQVLRMEPLFYKEGNGVYRPNRVQSNRFKQHLDRVMASTRQKLEEPFVITLQSISQ